MRIQYPSTIIALAFIPFAIFSSCSKDDPEPEPVVQEPEPEKPEPEPEPEEEGWIIDKTFTSPLVYARHIERLNDGKMIIAADAEVAKINADGALDANFPIVKTNDVIRAMVLQADGKILIGGVFTTVNGQNAPYIARINSDGTVDASFSANHSITTIEPYETFVNTIAVQPDSKILAGGSFIARFNADGSIDNGFNPPQVLIKNYLVFETPFQDYISAMILQADGKVVLAGTPLTLRATPDPGTIYLPEQNIVRLNTNGTVDETFRHSVGFGAEGTVTPERPMIACIVQLSDDSFVIGGRFSSINGYKTTGPAYYLPLGSNGEYTSSNSAHYSRYGAHSGSPYTMLRITDDEILVGRLKRNGVPIDPSCILSLNAGQQSALPLFWYGAEGDPRVFSEARDMVRESANSVIVAGWFVDELGADYNYFSNNDVVTKTRGLLRMVKK